MSRFWLYSLLLLVLVGFLTGCQPITATFTATPVPSQVDTVTPLPVLSSPRPSETVTPSPTQTSTQTLTPTPSNTPVPLAVGPTDFPQNINPLTGLPVKDIEKLRLPPALVSISNAPVTTRPQSGLSYAAQVFEMYIGEGATRFLAVFYGEYPPETIDIVQGNDMTTQPVSIGPMRSGRLPYEKLRRLYRGFLVFASASDRVLEFLDYYHIVYGREHAEDVNTARILVTDLEAVAQSFQNKLKNPRLFGLRFDPKAPEGGKTANQLWIPFNFGDQVFWRYDPQRQAYLRTQDQEDGVTFVPSTDKINGSPLAFENVAIIFANYHFYDAAFFNIDLSYITLSPALLFRDGKMYDVFWTTGNDDYEHKTGLLRPLRFIDRQGNPISLHPGHTWIEILPMYTSYGETIESRDYRNLLMNQEPGSGNWAFYFNAPPFEGLPAPGVKP